MSMTEDEFIAIVAIDLPTLLVWVESGWLRPAGDASRKSYSDADLARARLVADLGGPMGVNEEGIDIILDLVDQLHGLRAALSAVGDAVDAQPDDIQHQLRALVRRRRYEIREL